MGRNRLCFTLNNYTALHEEQLANNKKTRGIMWARETGEQGTPHLQGYMEFSKQTGFKEIKTWGEAFHNMHLENAAGSYDHNLSYVKGPWEGEDRKTRKWKSKPLNDTFVSYGKFNTKGSGARTDIEDVRDALVGGMPVKEVAYTFPMVYAKYPKFVKEIGHWESEKDALAALEKEMEGQQPKPWQQKVIDFVSVDPDPRKVFWVWSEAGNMGKTWVGKYLRLNHNALILEPGRRADLAYIFAGNIKKTVVIDLPRTTAPSADSDQCHTAMNGLYNFIESLKNGYMISSKYESREVTFTVPHVVCFANYPPDKSKLSADRWVVLCLQKWGVNQETPQETQIEQVRD